MSAETPKIDEVDFTTPPDEWIENQGAAFVRGDQVEIAERLIQDLQASGETVYTDGAWWRYDAEAGVYQKLEHAELSRIVQGYAGKPSRAARQGVLTIGRSDVSGSVALAADQRNTPEFFSDAKAGLAFSNGFLSVSAGGLSLTEHAPENRARHAYSFPFDTEKEPTKWLNFLDSVFRDDADRAEKIELIREFIGACLIGKATTFPTALVLLGDGANGKTVASSVVESTMPRGSVCAIPPQDMSQEYRRFFLAGKLINIVSELPESDILDSESLKAVVDGNLISARDIREPVFQFKPVAGHLFSANRLPGTRDHTHAFWRRQVVIKFNRIFKEDEQDKGLTDKLIKEAPQVIVWALQGAVNLLRRGKYVFPESSEAEKQKWKKSADQVLAFVEEYLQPLDHKLPITRGIKALPLYKEFRSWSEERGHRPMALNKFGERMELLGYESHHTRTANYYAVELKRNHG